MRPAASAHILLLSRGLGRLRTRLRLRSLLGRGLQLLVLALLVQRGAHPRLQLVHVVLQPRHFGAQGPRALLRRARALLRRLRSARCLVSTPYFASAAVAGLLRMASDASA